MTLRDLVFTGARRTATALAAVFTLAGCGGDTPIEPCASGCTNPGEISANASAAFDAVGTVVPGETVRLRGSATADPVQPNGSASVVYDSIWVSVNGLLVSYKQKFSGSSFSLDVLASPEGATAQGNMQAYWHATGSGNKTKNGVASAQTSFTVPKVVHPQYISAELDFRKVPLDDGVAATGIVRLLSNGKTVPLVNGRALITPNDSLLAGVDSIAVVGSGSVQSQKRWINFQDAKVYDLEIPGPDKVKYDLIMGLTWSGKTQRWNSPSAPVFIIDDVGHIDAANGIWTRNTAVSSDKLLQSEDISNINYFVQTIIPQASPYSSAVAILASTNDSAAEEFQGSPVNFPSGYVYNGTTDETSLSISHSDKPESGVLKWATNLMRSGALIARGGWVSDLLESLGYNTNIDVASVGAIMDVEGNVKPFLSEVAEYFYSPQRPAGSGRLNGYDDFINNKSSPDQPVGAMSVSFQQSAGGIFVPVGPSHSSVPQGFEQKGLLYAPVVLDAASVAPYVSFSDTPMVIDAHQ